MILLKYEINRYKNKGSGLPFGVLILFGYFYIYPIIVKKIYPLLLSFIYEKHIFSIVTPILHLFIFSLSNLLLKAFYSLEHPWIEKFKCNNNSWPWKDDLENWKKLLKERRKTLFLNLFLIGPMLSFLFNFISLIKFDTSINKLPSSIDIAQQIFICAILNDFMFHIVHKIFHYKFFYDKIHYKHHEFNNPIGITAEYAHPLEYIFSNIIPGSLGPLLIKNEIHVVGVWAWLIFGICATVEQHSGYEFPFSPFGIFPFSFASSYHDYHHTRYKYNYSSNFVFWDFIFGDNKEYFAFYEKKLEKLKNFDNKIT